MIKKIMTLLLVIRLCACSSGYELRKQTFTFELGDDVYANASNYIKDPEKYNLKNVMVRALSQGIRVKENRFVSGSKDYLVCGEYNFELVDGKKETKFRIKVKDTKPPTLSEDVTEIKIAAGSGFAWQDYLKASDLSGVSYSFAPIVDTTIAGSTDVTVKIYDRFGNTVEKVVTVKVE